MESMGKKYNLEQISLDLLTCSSNLEVCKRSGISETTLFRIKQREDFKEILGKQKEKLFGRTMEKAQVYSLEALTILMEIAKNKEAPPSSRVSACSKVLEFGQTAFDQEVILKKLEELERRSLEEDNEE